MFQVDDIIIYGSHGVCQVTAVGKIPTPVTAESWYA